MSQSIQLHIPTPCHENWAAMQPTEKGRHCQACAKTVVDFTTMSDAEVLRYFATAGPNVCGRLAPDQVNRNLTFLSPPQRNGWSGWRWLLAGAFITSQPPSPNLRISVGEVIPAKPIHQQPIQPITTDTIPLVGKLAWTDPVPHRDTVHLRRQQSIEIRPDTGHILIGTPRLSVADSTQPSVDTPPIHTTQKIADLSSPDTQSISAIAGGIVCIRPRKMDSLRQRAADTAASIQRFLTDTLTTLHLLPKRTLMVYPNPVPRGSTLRVSWGTVPGTYQLTLLNSAGMLIQERALEVSSANQVDHWDLPAKMPAGIYFLRATRPGHADNLTRELVVE